MIFCRTRRTVRPSQEKSEGGRKEKKKKTNEIVTLRPRDPANYHPKEDKNEPTIDSIKPRIREEREREAALYGDRAKSPQELEDEAGQEAAFNPETGEINWDCPCLGGMAHGPCGEAFKAAFSCFVYSNEEPKGIDCIEKFKCVLLLPHTPFFGNGLMLTYYFTEECRIASAHTQTSTAQN